MCVGKLSVRENLILRTVCRENIFLENCPLEKSMNCALENFLWATVCHGNVREGTAPLCKCFIRIFKFLRWTCQLHLIHYNIFNILIMLVAFIRVSLLRLCVNWVIMKPKTIRKHSISLFLLATTQSYYPMIQSSWQRDLCAFAMFFATCIGSYIYKL